MTSRPAKARFLIALLSALLIFEAGATAPASVVAQDPSEAPPSAEPAPPDESEPASPTASAEPSPSPAFTPPPSLLPTSTPTPAHQEPAPPDADPPGVERVDLRSADSRTFEQPDGTLVTEFFSGPVHFQPAGSEEWQPIDLTFDDVAGRGDVDMAVDGSPARLSLSAADDPDGFLRLDGGDHTIRFLLPLGSEAGGAESAPQLGEEGRFVDYDDFLPGGIGLRVFARPDGFKSFLVLHERPATNSFSLAIEAPGLTLVADEVGGFEFRDRDGNVVGRIPRPFMLDSSELEGRGGGLYSEAVSQSASETADGYLLTLTVEQAFLDEAVYPVYVDPTTTTFPTGSTTAGDSFVNSGAANTNYNTYQRPDSPYYHEMWHGNTPGTSQYNEIFIRFNSLAETLGGVKINTASLQFYPYWQYQHYQWRPSWVERVAGDWSAGTITWNNKPATNLEYGSQDSLEGQWANFDVKPFVQDVVNGVVPNYGLKLHANGTGQGNWKRIVSRNDSSSLKPKLVVVWDPFSATTPAHPIGGGPAASRTLSWFNDEAAVQVAYEVALSANNFSTTLATSGQLTSADTSWTIPSGTSLTAGSTYYWRVRTKLGSNSSFGAWSTTATFTWSPEANLGLAGHNTFESFDLGNGETLSVNVATGNLVVSAPQVSLPYRGGGLDITLFHNSFDPANVGMGPGWRLSTMARLAELGNGNVVYTAADGSRHTFTKSGSTYIRPDTLYATLVKNGSAPHWTLTWRDQSVDSFTTVGTEGLLSRSEDRHGNGIDYSYYASSNRLNRATDPTGRYVEFSWDTGVSPARLTQFTDWVYVSDNRVQTTQTGSRRLSRFFYDTAGQLIGWSDPKTTTGACPTVAFHLTCLGYASGQLTTITKRQLVAQLSGSAIGSSARNVTATIIYSGGRVAQVRDPEQTFANSTGTTFAYVGAGAMAVARRGSPASAPPSSEHTTTTYTQVGVTTDSLARIGSTKRKLGTGAIDQVTTWNSTYPTEPASVKDNAGGTSERIVSYTYGASMGLIASVAEPLTSTTTRTTSYTYNANNDVTQVLVASGGASTTTRYCYAVSGCATNGNTLTMRAQIDNWKDGNKGGAEGNEEDVTTEFLYDANGHGLLIRVTRFNYDAAGNLLDQRATGYEYDSDGNLTKEIVNYANGQVDSPGDDVTPNATTNARTDLTTVHEYDTAGNRISSADPRRAVEVAKNTNLGADDFITRWAYDTLNLRVLKVTPTTPGVSITCASWAPNCRETVWVYDGEQRLRSTRDFGNLVTANVYDRAGRVIETLEDPANAGGTTPAVKTSSTAYDASGRVLTAKDRAKANGAAGQTAYTYDEVGRLVSLIEAQDTGDPVETASLFDALGRQTQQSYGGQLTKTRFDLGGRVTEQDDGFACTRTTYDYRDLAITVIEGLASGTSACTGTGLRTLTNEYDGLGRLTESKVTTGEGLNDIPSKLTYDGAGNALSSAAVSGGTSTGVDYTVNPLDQVVRETRTDGSKARSNYDPAGNATDQCYWASGTDEPCQPVNPTPSFTNPPSRHTSSMHDARNQRIELADAATETTTTYDPDHNYQPAAIYVPTGSGRERQTLFGYDERHRVISITHQLCNKSADPTCASATLLGKSEYTYDQNDNRTGVVENNGATSSDRRYCYDAQNRLIFRNTGAACSSTTKDEAYTYDPAGNRTQAVENINGTTTTRAFTHNADGQLSGCSPHCGTPGSTTVTHDDAGRTRSANGWWFSYDGEGRLTKACKDSGCAANQERIEFTYDGEGRRTEIKTAPANGTFTTLELRYQGSSVVEEWVSGTLSRFYTVGQDGAIVKMIIPSGANAGTYLVTWNGHGDALALHRIKSDGSVELANSFTYSTWGTPSVDGAHPNSANSNANYGDLGFRYLYVGQFGVQWDNTFGLGLHYMKARHYSPSLGRFVQPDPSRLETNQYAYAGNNPVTKVDPSGRFAIVFPVLALVIVGIAAVALVGLLSHNAYIVINRRPPPPLSLPCLWNCSPAGRGDVDWGNNPARLTHAYMSLRNLSPDYRPPFRLPPSCAMYPNVCRAVLLALAGAIVYTANQRDYRKRMIVK